MSLLDQLNREQRGRMIRALATRYGHSLGTYTFAFVRLSVAGVPIYRATDSENGAWIECRFLTGQFGRLVVVSEGGPTR